MPGEMQDKLLKDQLFEILKLAILTCELPPGTELSEGYISSLYGVGKASVRHALSRLGQDGWVKSIPRIGHVVTPINISDVEDIYAMRLIVEPEAAALAAGRISKLKLRKLVSYCAASYTITDADTKRRFLLANRHFHIAIAQASGSTRLTRTVEHLHDESLRVLYLSITEKEQSGDWIQRHTALLDAISQGDSEGARKAAREGIAESRDSVLHVLGNSTILIAGTKVRTRLPKVLSQFAAG